MLPERNVPLLSVRPRAAANTWMRESKRSTLFWDTFGLDGLQQATATEHIGQVWITLSAMTDPVLLLPSYKTPDFSQSISGCCHPAPRQDCEADCSARSSVAARTASSSSKLLPSAQLGVRLGKRCIRLAPKVLLLVDVPIHTRLLLVRTYEYKEPFCLECKHRLFSNINTHMSLEYST